MRFFAFAALWSVFTFYASAPLHAADNWPQWRGPDGNGVVADGEYPVSFSADDGIEWKVALPGLGSSTPAVWDDSIFVTCGIDGQDSIVCYGMDGEERWRESLGKGRPGKSPHASGSNPSPVTDGKHVVCYFKSGRVACLDFKGNELWQVNLQEKYGKDTLWWDLGTSPVLAADNVIIAVIQEGDSYVVALNLAAGDVAWKVDRNFKRPEESDQAYTTPTVTQMGETPLLVVWGADHLTGYDARNGDLQWSSGQHPNFNPENEGMWRVIASHAMGGDVAVVPYGRGKFLTAVDLGDADEDLQEDSILWNKEGIGADVPTPVVHDDRVYVLNDGGKVSCLDLKTGAEIWSGQLPKSRHKFYASPMLAGDKLYCINEGGETFVVRVGDKFELLAENDMDERVVATPVAIRNGLLIRGETHLFRISGEDAEKTTSTGK
jgi:outer membrane protein assembly factor BamB